MILDNLLKSVKDYLESEYRGQSQKLHLAERAALLQHISEARRQLAIDGATDVSVEQIEGGTDDIRRIMVAVDNSEQAKFAVKFAAKLAQKLHCALSLIHVIHLPFGTDPDMPVERAGANSWRVEGGHSLLNRMARRLSPVIPVETLLRYGDPATEISGAANRLGADLLIIGTHGRGKYTSAVVGSVAQGVMRHASCPVVCVSHDSPHPREADETIEQASHDYFPTVGV